MLRMRWLRCARVATKALLPLLARPNSHSDTGMKVLRLGPCRCPSGKPLSMRAPPPPPETVNSASHYPLHRPFRRREQPAVKPSPPSSLPADPHDRLAPVPRAAAAAARRARSPARGQAAPEAAGRPARAPRSQRPRAARSS
eukprot:CAMPEP_0181222860 /NCGR_PEP_ID=MMETSP1096-20121128/30202_1 /TAXON_ID=156174 ORGANISM="Chrysochromulina ericina, Strain CCMP281" /NCGR_SAMPLE_ID=MMETSP1096 /ASSEMBLY_ACC=CAM_ASM_000453 /LENGTH=141 /DNA_ID=CAMNT_0023315671 /DNA_START=503 /DNA_END=924 /DNA_ORIENTATION=-